jgi:DNA-binding LytR/AlgR family response regulator
MNIKCLIVDDEPLAILLIENHISKINGLEVVATANNALKAFEIINTQSIDLMFLDIKMPNITGIDFLRTLKNPPKTILTTAYRDFAIEGFELEVSDYLLKPILFERFFKSMERFLRENKTNTTPEINPQKKDYMIVKSGNKNHKVTIEEILYIESLKDYIKIHTRDGENIVSKFKISDIEDKLPNKQFIRIHRSYIINTEKITAFTTSEIEVNGIEIPIGASYKETAEQFLKNLKH